MGGQATLGTIDTDPFVWAVRNGDVATIPEPASYVLLLLGLASVGLAKRRTAVRDINELPAHGVLRKTAAGGRSTHYELNESSAN